MCKQRWLVRLVAMVHCHHFPICFPPWNDATTTSFGARNPLQLQVYIYFYSRTYWRKTCIRQRRGRSFIEASCFASHVCAGFWLSNSSHWLRTSGCLTGIWALQRDAVPGFLYQRWVTPVRDQTALPCSHASVTIWDSSRLHFVKASEL